MSVKSGIWSINDATTESNINFVLPRQQNCGLMDSDTTLPCLGYSEDWGEKLVHTCKITDKNNAARHKGTLALDEGECSVSQSGRFALW